MWRGALCCWSGLAAPCTNSRCPPGNGTRFSAPRRRGGGAPRQAAVCPPGQARCGGGWVTELALPARQRHKILCSAAARVWRPAPGCGLPTGADKGRWLAGFITTTWEELGRPCTERAIEHALACAGHRIRAHDDERAVLVHGDVHQWNALEAQQGFKLVDPDGLLAEAEYDLGVLMREDPLELLDGDPQERARWLARRCGLNTTAIWEWGVIERVSTGPVPAG